jgi:hypothetical protein
MLRLAGCAALVALPLLGWGALRPAVFEALGLDWWDWPNCLRQYDAASERAEELAQKSRVALGQMQAKDAIARDLIAGRLSLAEATRLFLEMPRTTEFVRRYVRECFPGATAEEGMSRYVIQWACDMLPQQPDREVLCRRLEAELAEHLALAR